MQADGSGMNLVLFVHFSEEVLAEIQRIAPSLRIHTMSRKDPLYDEILPKADIVVGGLRPSEITVARSLRWLQISSAGVGSLPEQLPERVVLTNGSGIYGVPISEHVLAMMLGLIRCIPEAVRNAAENRWQKSSPKRGLFGSTCGVIGMGDIGTEVARRAKGMGMRVVAVKRLVRGEKPEFVDALYDTRGLDNVLQESDHVVICLPGTVHTRHLFDSRRLNLMKPGSYIYNIGRGMVIDEGAMIEALRSHHLAGAGLDVFEKEPLPPESPLWGFPNVILTSHYAGSGTRNTERLAEIFLHNLRQFLAGQPMRNVVDREWGY